MKRTIWWTNSDLQIVFIEQVTVQLYEKDYLVDEIFDLQIGFIQQVTVLVP